MEPQIKLTSARSRFFTAARFSKQKPDASKQKEEDGDLTFFLSISASVEKKITLDEGRKPTIESKEALPWPSVVDYYDLKEIIGVGNYTKVYSAYCKSKGENCAIKIIDLRKWSQSNLDNLLKEVASMSSLNHENIMTYHGTFVDKDDLWLVLCLMSQGSLLDVIRRKQKAGSCKNGVFDEDVIATILTGVVNGLTFLHQHGYVHKNIKAENILLGVDGSVKISDFSIVNCISKFRKYIGSPRWLAPEITSHPKEDKYSDKADIWSLGITAIEIATGAPPYHKFSTMKVLLLVTQNKPPTLETDAETLDQYDKYGKLFRSFIADCLVKDPSCRPTANELLFHKFFNKSKDNEFLKKVLAAIPFSAEPKFTKAGKEEDPPRPAVRKEWVLTKDELLMESDVLGADVVTFTSELDYERKIGRSSTPPFPSHSSHGGPDPEHQSTKSFWSCNSKGQKIQGQIYHIILKIRLPRLDSPMILKTSIRNKRDLVDISFSYETIHDNPESIAEDLVREGLLDPKDRQPVAANLKKLLDPAFKSEVDPPSVTFRLNSGTCSKETVCEWNLVGFATLIIQGCQHCPIPSTSFLQSQQNLI